MGVDVAFTRDKPGGVTPHWHSVFPSGQSAVFAGRLLCGAECDRRCRLLAHQMFIIHVTVPARGRVRELLLVVSHGFPLGFISKEVEFLGCGMHIWLP